MARPSSERPQTNSASSDAALDGGVALGGGAGGWIKRKFHRAGSPRWFFAGSRRPMIALYTFGIALILLGSIWGLGFVPPERYQGDSFRILFIHVPAAFLAQSIYVAIAVAGLVYLVWRMKMADVFIAAAAPIGAAIAAAALATGFIWGMPTWGTGWVWDARTISTLVLLFLFFGLVALRQAIAQRERAAAAVALLAVVGVVNIPVIKYSVEWFATLHQPPSLELGKKPAIAAVYLWPLACNVLGYFCFAAGAVLAACRATLVERQADTEWVRRWLRGGVRAGEAAR